MPTAQKHQQIELAFKNAGDELAQKIFDLTLNSEIKELLKKLIANVERLKFKNTNPEHTIMLTQIFTQTQTLLNPHESLDECTKIANEYEEYALTVHGNPSPGMRTIGAIMLALCAASIALALAAIAVPIACAAASTLLLTSSVCFFSGRRHDLSAKMGDLATEKIRSFVAPA